MIINYSDQPVMCVDKSIFLVGPTPRRNDVKSWRPEACKNRVSTVLYMFQNFQPKKLCSMLNSYLDRLYKRHHAEGKVFNDLNSICCYALELLENK